MATSQCKACAGSLRRSRRGLLERLLYAEAFRCDACGARSRTALWNWRYMKYVKCPCCHSVDLTILNRPDRIDRMEKGLMNMLQRFAGGKLYHCWFCRLQFYDRRKRFNDAGIVSGTAVKTEPESDVELAS